MSGYEIPEVYDYQGYPPGASAYLQPSLPPGPPYCPQEGYGEYYGMEELDGEIEETSRGRSRHRRRSRLSRRDSVSESSSASGRSSSVSTTSSSHTENASKLQAGDFREPSFMDAFKVMYLAAPTKSKSTGQYLMTEKKRDHINDLLELDGLGSKRLLFYPRAHSRGDLGATESRSSTTSDRRVKVEGSFLRDLKDGQGKKDAPIAKLKRWELLMYKKLGFVQAV